MPIYRENALLTTETERWDASTGWVFLPLLFSEIMADFDFNDGEYEKSASLFEQLLEKDERSEYYFNRFVESLIQLEQYDRCEKAIKKQIRNGFYGETDDWKERIYQKGVEVLRQAYKGLQG